MKKKMLVYAYYAKNIGDDLFLKVLFDRYPDAEWDLLTANRNYREVFKAYPNVKIIYTYREIAIGKRKYNLFFKLNETFFRFSQYDGLVIIGGSIFIQSPAWRIKLEEREYLLDKFKERGKKTYLLGPNFGPYEDEEFLNRYRNLFSKFDDVCFRDSYSYNLFSDLPNVRLAPDIVFTMQHNLQYVPEKTAGFSLINLSTREALKEYGQDYEEKISQTIRAYCEKGYTIKLFSFCENEGDLSAITKIKEKTGPEYSNQIQRINYEGDPDAFLEEFQSCQLIIGTRFHSIILAILFGRPFFALLYSEKVLNLLKDLGMKEYCWQMKDIQNLNIDEMFDLMVKRESLPSSKLSSQAERQFEELDALLASEKRTKEVMRK